MSVDVSKMAVDARKGAIAERKTKLADARRILLALILATAAIVGIRLYEREWAPIGWNVLIVIVALGFAGGAMERAERARK